MNSCPRHPCGVLRIRHPVTSPLRLPRRAIACHMTEGRTNMPDGRNFTTPIRLAPCQCSAKTPNGHPWMPPVSRQPYEHARRPDAKGEGILPASDNHNDFESRKPGRGNGDPTKKPRGRCDRPASSACGHSWLHERAAARGQGEQGPESRHVNRRVCAFWQLRRSPVRPKTLFRRQAGRFGFAAPRFGPPSPCPLPCAVPGQLPPAVA